MGANKTERYLCVSLLLPPHVSQLLLCFSRTPFYSAVLCTMYAMASDYPSSQNLK